MRKTNHPKAAARSFALLVLLACSPALAQDTGREHFIPFFMSADDPDGRQGFLRIINHSDRGGTVRIYGVDDAGVRRGPARLTIDALETVHVNSGDVERGNADKGLSNGLGAGEGNWRLLIYGGNLDIEPLSYIRTIKDGFLTSMHDVVGEAATRHRVPIFNPGSNDRQRSWLRLINPATVEANVTITGRDDAGAASTDSARLTIEAGAAATVAAQDLEAGTGGLVGQLGDGSGKWSLSITADVPILAMSLMSTPTGHLSNLSAAKREYRGATGLWRIAFEDQANREGYLLLLSDSRMYAWLPEAGDVDRIARGTYRTGLREVSGAGELFESGKVELAGLDVSGGSEPFDLTAEYRTKDWIRGTYTATGGSPRAFHGWAFTGFERGASREAVTGLWQPADGADSDLPGDFEPAAGGGFDFTFSADAISCDVDGVLGAINPAFSVYEAVPTIRCLVLEFPTGSVEMLFVVMDAPTVPGGGGRALALVLIPDERKIAFGAVFELSGS